MERTPIMSADLRTISRRRIETAETHQRNFESPLITPEVLARSQERDAGSSVPADGKESGWLRSAMIAQYSLCTQLAAELNAQNPSHYMTARATHFLESSDASRYIEETIAELETNPSPYDTVEVFSSSDFVFRGDRSAAYSYSYAMSDYVASSGIAVLIQKESRVYEFEVEGPEAPGMAPVHAAIEKFLDCVQEGGETADDAAAQLTAYAEGHETAAKSLT
jgi:hypothetical protein